MCFQAEQETRFNSPDSSMSFSGGSSSAFTTTHTSQEEGKAHAGQGMSLVIKFDDRFVEEGDYLRGTSVVLFRSLFGRDQKPSEGVAIDDQGAQPRIYGDEDGPDPLHAELWSRFWEYANDPDLARERGVRAMQGEAPFMELRKGKIYRIDLRASGGLTIQSE